MAKPFDATLNSLIDLRPDDWANGFGRLAGIPPGPSTALDTDLATTLQADKLFRIDGPRPAILHLELEANPRLGIPRELLRYNTLIDLAHDLPVHTVLILLRPKALASDQTGHYERFGADGGRIAAFDYRVERVWERPVEYWLNGGVGLSPLALLTDEAGRDLEGALDALCESFRERGVEDVATKSLLGSSFVLCGLRYQQPRIVDLFRRVAMLMEESTTYQWILDKGRDQGLSQGLSEGLSQGLSRGRRDEARSTVVRLGTKRFGAPPESAVAALQRIDDLAELERLTDRVLDAVNWEDLLKGP